VVGGVKHCTGSVGGVDDKAVSPPVEKASITVNGVGNICVELSVGVTGISNGSDVDAVDTGREKGDPGGEVSVCTEDGEVGENDGEPGGDGISTHCSVRSESEFVGN